MAKGHKFIRLILYKKICKMQSKERVFAVKYGARMGRRTDTFS
jgi:hypothetical protein